MRSCRGPHGQLKCQWWVLFEKRPGSSPLGWRRQRARRRPSARDWTGMNCLARTRSVWPSRRSRAVCDLSHLRCATAVVRPCAEPQATRHTPPSAHLPNRGIDDLYFKSYAHLQIHEDMIKYVEPMLVRAGAAYVWCDVPCKLTFDSSKSTSQSHRERLKIRHIWRLVITSQTCPPYTVPNPRS